MLRTTLGSQHAVRLPRTARRGVASLALALLGAACGGDRKSELRPAELECEVKVGVPASSIARALQALELKEAQGEARTVWFYDTPVLELFDKGIILRSRHGVGEPDDTTVKLRPMDASKADPSWSSVKGFKCEQDRTARQLVTSCSLTRAAKRGAIDAAAKGPPAIAELFDDQQQSFMREYAPLPIDWASLRALGPIDARVWKVRSRPLDRKLGVERWRLPDGTELLEISTRVSASEAEKLQVDLAQYLATLGLEADPDSATKTRFALEKLVSR